MKQIYISRSMSIMLLLSALVAFQPTPIRAIGFLEQALLGAAIGTAAGITVAKIEERLENKEGEVPVGHRVWLWPTAWFVRRLIDDKLAELAGYRHAEFVPFVGVSYVPNEEVTYPALIAAWASWFAMREWRASQREQAKRDDPVNEASSPTS